ncbi:MAG TPA: peptidase M4 family protein, partial [Bacillus bacterium]|nr:peptidase M4 family protein [Bacillus sp. (in: firmicutes)]
MEKKKFVIPMLLSTALIASPLITSPVQAVQSDHAVSTLAQKNTVTKQQNSSVFLKADRAFQRTGTGAVQFVEENKERLKLNNPGQNLIEKNKESDQFDMTHVKLQQTKNGIPVEGAELIVHDTKEGTV